MQTASIINNYKEEDSAMFTKHPDNMRMEPTPERVYSICRLISQNSISKDDLKELVSLGKSNTSSSSSSIINYSLDVAEKDLDVIRLKDGKYSIVVDPVILNSPQSFRQYVAKKAFSDEDSTFFMFSRWYISKNEEVFALGSWEVQSKTAEREISKLKGIDENAALGWRFWAAFLGLGYLNETTLIPNMKTRIQDVLASSFSKQLNFNEPVRAMDFINWADSLFPECDLKNRLPLAFSAGLRTLSELGLIAFDLKKDTDKISLYKVEGEINEFSHITVAKEVQE